MNWNRKNLREHGPERAAETGGGADAFAEKRAAMVEQQIRRRGVTDPAVLEAMRSVPRHEFVAAQYQAQAYEDGPLPIGGGQTISQPYMVAVMTAALELKPPDRVLDVGTGSGYQAAVLSRIAQEVYAVEVREDLCAEAKQRLERLGYGNVRVFCRDGTLGLAEHAPYDGILVAAAAPAVPEPLLGQLAEGGRLVIPVGDAGYQELELVRLRGGRLERRRLDACQFVPLIGYHGWPQAPPR
ncbi:MAG TPA: protein-L-isoaspartate(D-aspartate) O-methyltransferase [Candidatus Acidoferrales bacterium]|nr:protein-L-isoaspartate(D-aspartate) O-methyltransferase [Candidatus Acidoferrales bacterium]